jgi:two-component system competent response regulator ComA
MREIVIVDHPVFAEGLALFLRTELRAEAVSVHGDPARLAQPRALVLVELLLPSDECGLTLARRLQTARPDLTTVVWTSKPVPVSIWAAVEHKVPGFLDKQMPLRDLRYWLEHALVQRAAWPGQLLEQARDWDREVAPRLAALGHELWNLWASLLRREKNGELGARMGWSPRTLERRLSELYTALGVQGRADAISVGWEWGLVHQHESRVEWNPFIRDLFKSQANHRAA